MSAHRADARFLLPRNPKRALVNGADGWVGALERAGIEVGTPPDLVVTREPARSHGAPMVVVEGRSRALPGAAGYVVERFLALPSIENAELYVPLERPAGAAYALRHLTVPGRRWKRWRNRVFETAIRARALPPLTETVTVAVREPGPPFVLAAAGGLLPDDMDWVLGVPGPGDELRRGLFHVFPRGETEPDRVVKFVRVPGYSDPFDRDERGLRVAADAGGVVSAHAPRLLGRFVVDGIHAAVETAAVGSRLISLLHSDRSRAAKVRLIDGVADWTVAVASATRGPVDALAAERRRLEETVGADLVSRLPPLAPVLQHNDLGTWNVVVGRRGFTALDWESARVHGLPLWDLWYFLADALAHLDGATSSIERERHFTRLFASELPSSETLFRWTRAAADATSVPVDALGVLASLCWLHHARSRLARIDAAQRHSASSPPTFLVDRAPALWSSHPGLGRDWPAVRG